MPKDVIQIDRAGRLVLPKPIRKRFSLNPGDTLKLSVDENGIHLKPQAAAGEIVRKGSVLVFTGQFGERVTSELVQRIIDEEREQFAEKLPLRKR